MIRYYHLEDGFSPADNYKEGDWIHLEGHEKKELEQIVNQFNIPANLLADIYDIDERPRVDSEQGWTLVIIRTPRKRDGLKLHFATVPLFLIFKEKTFISICSYPTEALTDFLVYSKTKKINNITAQELVVHLLMNAAVWFMNYTKTINDETSKAEAQMLHNIRNDDLQKLMHWEKSLVYFEAALRGNQILLDKLLNYLQLNANSGLYTDARTELYQAYEMVLIYHNTLKGTMTTFSSVISNNVNLVMKRMTALSLILMLPTLIASFYGMNLINHSEQSEWAFLIICGISLLLSGCAFWILKHKKWL